MDRKITYSVLAGLLLLAAAQAGLAMLPTGSAEFAYLPFHPHLPWSAMRGFTAEQLGGHLLRILLATPALVLISFGLGRLAAARLGPGAPGQARLDRLVLAAGALSLLYMTGAHFLLYAGHPIIDDELAYRLQARLLADGKLGFTLPQLVTIEPFTVKGAAGFTGKYLPGEPLVQLPGVLVGHPGLMHLPLALLTLLCVHRMVALLADRSAAAWATILLALSPTFLLTTPSGQSPPTELFCLALAGFGYAHLRKERPGVAGAICLGVGIGFGMMVRPQAAMPVGTVLVAAAGLRLLRARRFGVLALLLGVLALWAGAILAYNQAVTGSIFKLPWALHPDSEHYGFGPVWQGGAYEHSLVRALENLGVVLVRFNAWWLGAPSSLLLVWLWFRQGRPGRGVLGIWLVAAGALLLFEFFYYSTGVSDTGPVYHYELLLPLTVLGGVALGKLFAASPRRAMAWVAVHFVLGTVPFVAGETARVGRLIHLTHAAADQALETVKKPALLLHEQDCAEVLRAGWIFNTFPRQYRSDNDPVVTFPRPPWGLLPQYLEKYRDRTCYYYRLNPASGRRELIPCRAAQALLRRPMRLTGPCLRHISTAEQLGLFDQLESASGAWRSE